MKSNNIHVKRTSIVTGLNLHSYAQTAGVENTAGTKEPRKQNGQQDVEELNINETAVMRKNCVNIAKTKLNVDVDVIEITADHRTDDVKRQEDRADAETGSTERDEHLPE